MRLTHDELVQRLKDCAESIIENAESIVGNEEFISGLTIELNIDSYDEAPTIILNREFVAENYINRLRDEFVLKKEEKK